MPHLACFLLFSCSLIGYPCLAADAGPKLGQAQTVRMQIGVIVKADGPCHGIVATTPVPIDWPEQQVKMLDEETSPQVKKVTYRLIGKTARQMVVEIPQLSAGEEAKALVTFEVTRHTLAPPEDTSLLILPTKLDRELRTYLTESPSIETRHAKIRALAKEAAAETDSAWEKVEALYDTSRTKVQYKFGPLKGGLKALEDGDGDCEDISSLFIAMCRASEIPAHRLGARTLLSGVLPGGQARARALVSLPGGWRPCLRRHSGIAPDSAKGGQLPSA